MTKWTKGATLALAALALAGCQGGGSAGGKESPEPSSPTTSSSAPVATLKDTCPLVEQALPKAYLPTAAKLTSFSDRLEELAAQGDAETQNAIELLAAPTRDYIEVADQSGGPLADAMLAFLNGISAFAKRCKAAGSSALQ